MAASIANVPLPCSGMATWLPVDPASAARRVRTPSLSVMKSWSRDPQSLSRAARVREDVVSGPGVSSSRGWSATMSRVQCT
jgi:hypothetical protein